MHISDNRKILRLQLKDIGKTRANQNPNSRKSKLKNTEKLGMEAEAGGSLCFPGQPYLCSELQDSQRYILRPFINKTKNPQKSRKQSGVLEGKQNCQNKLGVFAGSSRAHSEMEEDITHNRSRGSQGMTAAAAVLQNRKPKQICVSQLAESREIPTLNRPTMRGKQ